MSFMWTVGIFFGDFAFFEGAIYHLSFKHLKDNIVSFIQFIASNYDF